jgi:hypothetical protein
MRTRDRIVVSGKCMFEFRWLVQSKESRGCFSTLDREGGRDFIEVYLYPTLSRAELRMMSNKGIDLIEGRER